MENASPTHALVREVSAGFARAVSTSPEIGTLDVSKARTQHRAYVSALKTCGLEITVLPGHDSLPDCCFIEDSAVVGTTRALLTRPGHPARQAEPAAVGEALKAFLELIPMEPPATLDGGDCLRIGRTIYVGHSQRTNEAGIDTLRRTFADDGYSIQVVQLGDILHLKCVCSYLGRGHVLVTTSQLPAGTFKDLQIVEVPPEESYAANAVAVGGTVLMAAGFPRTKEAIERAGFRTIPLDMSEFRKADGSFTCLSVLFRPRP